MSEWASRRHIDQAVHWGVIRDFILGEPILSSHLTGKLLGFHFDDVMSRDNDESKVS